MNRTNKVIQIESIDSYNEKILNWASQFEYCCWLDSNQYPQQYSSAEAILAVGAASKIELKEPLGAFEILKAYQNEVADYLFGYLSYDLKNDVEQLSSNNFDGLKFPALFFFQPKKIFILRNNHLELKYLDEVSHEIDSDLDEIKRQEPLKSVAVTNHSKHQIKSRITQKDYCDSIEKILKHIQRGDIYEVNFCQEFYVEDCEINPLTFYKKLNQISKAPFASFLRLNDCYALCTSPERYLKKQGAKVISQPIKGTARRSTSAVEDQALADNLKKDSKELAENIMIVDLVRNDLSKFAKKGSVKVEELCKVYPFEQVHQMISTVVCELAEEIHPVDLIKATFPMGSMTGAPKVSAMKIIEEREVVKRGLYSGAIGYFTPDNDFDFNVVIRSLLYHGQKKNASYIAGGAITSKSTPEAEYQESLLKAKAMSLVFSELFS